MIRVSNVLLDASKLSHVVQDPDDINRVTAFFDNGEHLVFVGQEAAELWALLDEDKGWREKES